MPTNEIRFDDGAAYERYMGKWSQLVGETFLDWLAPKSGLRWLDVGCGNGAFTEMLVQRCAPASVHGIDPSEAQLAYARTRSASRIAQFRQGDAMALPFPDDMFDAAVMPLVIFFVPEPAKGVAEMVRVVCPGGIVAAYAWDMLGSGFPYETLRDELRGMGIEVPLPPSPDASRIEAMRDLWKGAGLEAVETRELTVQRTFADFDDYWTTIQGGPSVGGLLKAMSSADIARLKERMRQRLPTDAAGRITCSGRANAVVGSATTGPRKRPALDAGHSLQRRSEPGAQGSWRSDLAVLRRIVLGLLRRDKSVKRGPAPRALIAGDDQMTLLWAIMP